MGAIILVLFLSAGVLAQHQPPLTQKFRQDGNDIPFRSPSVLAREIAVETLQDDVDFARESETELRTKQMTLKSKVPSGNNTECDFPFVKVGTSCYFFSSEQKTFADAEAYCETLGHGHAYESTLTVMEYDRHEDEALLNAVTDRSNTFWIGGNTEDGDNWSWVDGRPLSLQVPLWYYAEPNTVANKCVVAQVSTNGNNIRSYLYDSECSDSLNFICQTRFPEHIFEFRKIGNDYYFLSEEVGLPTAHWQEARDFCKDLLVPVGYHADLAVLNMTQQDDYDLLYNLVPVDAANNYNVWIGAVAEADDCIFNYIDGRSLPTSSSYWHYSQPTCGDERFVSLHYYVNHNQIVLEDWTESSTFNFICQLFKNT